MAKTKGLIKIEITNTKELFKGLNGITPGMDRALQRTISDFRSRAPSWVSQAVRNHYGIAARDISPKTKKDVENKVKKAGQVYSRGKTLHTLAIAYYGRVLTPTHFNMEEKEPKQGPYNIKATILKGRRKRIGGRKALTKEQKRNIGRNFTHQGKRHRRRYPALLMHTGAKKANKTQYIPMRLMENDKWHVIKTLSLPQMVENESVQKDIQRNVDKNLYKRARGHVEKELKRAIKNVGKF